MSLKYRRYENPNPGQTLLLGPFQVTPWVDPQKNPPLPPLESQKGIFFPTWYQLGLGTLVYFGVLGFQHFRFKRYPPFKLVK